MLIRATACLPSSSLLLSQSDHHVFCRAPFRPFSSHGRLRLCSNQAALDSAGESGSKGSFVFLDIQETVIARNW